MGLKRNKNSKLVGLLPNSYSPPLIVDVIYDDPKHVIVTLNVLSTYMFVTAVFSYTVAWIVNVITLSFIPCGAVIPELVGEAIFIPSVNIILTIGDG